MPKRSPKKKKVSQPKVIYVKSRTYGDHPRAARGTYKKAQLNEAFKQENKNLISANRPAKLFNDAIAPYRKNLAGGLLWQRLGSLFRQQFKQRGRFDFENMERFEIHLGYRFDRFFQVQPDVQVSNKKSAMLINLGNDHHPDFSKTSYIDGYRLTAIGIFPDLVKNTVKSVAAESIVYALSAPVVHFQAKLSIPPNAKNYIVCLKIEGCEKNKVNNLPSTTGICVLSAGTLTKTRTRPHRGVAAR